LGPLKMDRGNVQKRKTIALRKVWEEFKNTTVQHERHTEMRNMLLQEKWGCKKLKVPWKGTPSAIERAMTNFKEKVLPLFGHHTKALVQATVCEGDKHGTVDSDIAVSMDLDPKKVGWARDRVTNPMTADRTARTKATLGQDTPANCNRQSMCEEVEKMYVDFFERSSFVPSGAKTKLRHVAIAVWELYADLYAVYPQMLRELHDKHPELTDVQDESTKTYTVLQACLLTAQHWKDRAGSKFDLQAEVELRRAHKKDKYRRKLEHSLWTRRGHKVEALGAEFDRKTEHLRNIATWDPEKFTKVKPVSVHIFYNILKRNGVKYTYKVKMHPCKLHQNGPGWVANYHKAVEEVAELQKRGVPDSDMTYKKKVHEQEIWRCQKVLYDLHIKQFNACRPFVKQVEAELGEGECLIYRDFVNMNTHEGGKVWNLILTRLSKDKSSGDLVVLKLHNIMTDKKTGGTTCFVMADVMDHHFKKKVDGGSGYLDQFDVIYLVGDHGPHFAAHKTFYNESKVWQRYGKRLFILFLCAYHGYNRCDGAGVQIKRLAQAAERASKPLQSNVSTQHSSTAVPILTVWLPRLPRSTSLLICGPNT